MITRLGIPASHVKKVANPYQAQEITSQLSLEEKNNTALIFAVSEKDMQAKSEENPKGPRFSFGIKKNGEPSYLQPLPEDPKKILPMSQHAYVSVTPTVNFKVRGADANSAKQIRNLYINANPQDRDNIIVDLYGEAYPDIRDIFDQKLGTAERVQEVIYGTPIVDAGIKEPGMREHRVKLARLLESIQQLEQQVERAHESYDEDLVEDYIEERWSQKYKRSINCNNPKGFSQKAHCAGRKKK
jgi:hypothetical protein